MVYADGPPDDPLLPPKSASRPMIAPAVLPRTICPSCEQPYSIDCRTCQESHQKSALNIWGKFPWINHRPVWANREETMMICERCKKEITPEMTMRDLVGPCPNQVKRPPLPDPRIDPKDR